MGASAGRLRFPFAMASSTDREMFRARAAQARADAEQASLENVRDRCLRAEAAWIEMAERAERTERLRASQIADKARLAAAEEAKAEEAQPQIQDEVEND